MLGGVAQPHAQIVLALGVARARDGLGGPLVHTEQCHLFVVGCQYTVCCCSSSWTIWGVVPSALDSARAGGALVTALMALAFEHAPRLCPRAPRSPLPPPPRHSRARGSAATARRCPPPRAPPPPAPAAGSPRGVTRRRCSGAGTGSGRSPRTHASHAASPTGAHTPRRRLVRPLQVRTR